MTNENERCEQALNDMEVSCGVILNELYNLIQKDSVKTLEVVTAISTCLTLVIKNIERNLNDQDYDVNFDEILHEIKTIDLEFSDIRKKDE